jgi:hypothetical protein
MDDMGDRNPSVERQRSLQRQRLRIRTIAVSFRAAVSSAHRDLEVGPAERDALIEAWRAWSLDVLARYAEEVERMGQEGAVAELTDLEHELASAVDTVRRA